YSVSPGTATVTATYQGVSGSTFVTVSAATIKSIQVSPVNPAIAVNTQLRFTATAIYTDNTSQDITYNATWSSSNQTIAKVDNAGFQSGQVTALAPGQATISAVWSGVTGTTTVTVTAATLASIQLTPLNPTVPKNLDVQYTATGIYSDGTSKDLTYLA